MARTLSNMLSLDTKAPSFKLFDTTSGSDKSLKDLTNDKPFVVMFICNHCPFVIHLQDGIKNMVDRYNDEVDIIAISSNDVDHYPQDSPELMKELFSKLGLNIPYLYDERQEVAKAYEAACTPDFYLFNFGKKLVYRGQFDTSRPGNNIPVTGLDLFNAIDVTLDGGVVEGDQKPSLGCNIKWK